MEDRNYIFFMFCLFFIMREDSEDQTYSGGSLPQALKHRPCAVSL